MALEFVEVQFPEDRAVLVNGNESGRTNAILYLTTGTHRFQLGGPKDFQPEEITCAIYNTNALVPLVIQFQKVQI